MKAPFFKFCGQAVRFGTALLLLLAGLPAAVQAQYSYTTNNGAVTITQYSGGGGSVVIPDTIAGLPVTTIGPSAFFGAVGLTSVTMGTNLSTIGTNAFFQCQSLATVTFTGSVTNVGFGPFLDCETLTTITMTGPNAFITVSNNVIYNKSQTSLIQFPCGLTGIYTVPAPVTNVGQAFIGNSLTNISVNAANSIYSSTNGVLFDKLQTQLISYPGFAAGAYTVPSTVTTILSAAFEYSKNVTAVVIGANVSSIGYVAFFYCPSLTSITVNPANAFYATTNGVLFDKNLKQLIQYPLAVSGSYVVPGTVTNIADGAFGHASGLTSMVIPNSVTSIGIESFYVCQNLASVSIGSGVTTIGQQAFFFCPALKNIVIPGSVTNIGAYAFGDCQNLTNACFDGKEPFDGGNIFYFDTSLSTILYVSGSPGWSSSYDGYPTAPCTTCGGVAPTLAITRAGTNVILSWSSNSPGYTLEATTNLTASPSWTNVSGQYLVTNPITSARKYYRLYQ